MIPPSAWKIAIIRCSTHQKKIIIIKKHPFSWIHKRGGRETERRHVFLCDEETYEIFNDLELITHVKYLLDLMAF